VFLERVAATTLRHGAPDAASPVAQTVGVQNVVAGTSNTAGAAWTFAGSQGSGTGAGGSILFKTAPAGSTGSTQNSLVTALSIFGTGGVTVGAAPTGGDQGAGKINVSGGYYVNGGLISPTTAGTNGTLLQGVTSAAPTFTPTPTLGVAGSVVGSLAFANATSGSITLQPSTGALGSSVLTLPIATDTLVGKATTDIFTNKTFDTAGTGNSLKIGTQAISGLTGTGGTLATSTGAALGTPTITSGTFLTAITATGLVKTTDLATQAANTFLANVTNGVASPTAATLPSCTGSASAIQYTLGTGLSCGTITAAASSISAGTTVVNGGPGVLQNASNGGTLVSSTTLPSGLSATNISLTTPALGVATGTSLAIGGATIGTNALAVTDTSSFGTVTATSVNKVAITAPATSATLTIADGKTLTDTSGVGASILLGATGGGFTAYAGATCTNQVLTALSAAGAGTCSSITNAYLTAGTFSSITGVGALGAGSATTGFTINGASVTLGSQIPGANIAAVADASGAPSATFGVLKCDGTTITCASGIATAAGSSATAVTPGTTTVGGGAANPGYGLTNVAGTLTNTALFSTAGGYVNKFRNGTFAVWARGTSSLPTSSGGTYVADGWIVSQATAQGTCDRAAGNNGALYSVQCVGAASNTATTFKQRIESYDATPLAGQTVTVQFQYKQSSGGAVTPKVSTCFASATDNFGTCTSDLAATSLTSCANNTWCTESYTFTVSASASNGYQITLDCNTALSNVQVCAISAADVRVTPGVTTGINSNPPSPELRSVQAETAQCQRYLPTISTPGGSAIIAAGQANGTTTGTFVVSFPVSSRTTVTAFTTTAANFSMAQLGVTGYTALSAMTLGGAFPTGATLSTTASGATYTIGGGAVLSSTTTSASIIFTGAEL